MGLVLNFTAYLTLLLMSWRLGEALGPEGANSA